MTYSAALNSSSKGDLHLAGQRLHRARNTVRRSDRSALAWLSTVSIFESVSSRLRLTFAQRRPRLPLVSPLIISSNTRNRARIECGCMVIAPGVPRSGFNRKLKVTVLPLWRKAALTPFQPQIGD